MTCGHHHIVKLAEDTLIKSFSVDPFLRRVYDAGGEMVFDAELYTLTADALLKGFKKGWDKKPEHVQLMTGGIDYNQDDPALLTAFEQNIFRFSAAKTLAEVQELNAIFRQSSSFEEFMDLASKRFDIFNKTWLETEYNTAILTGEAAATYHRLIAKADLFPYWEYRTVGDRHVRKEHEKLDGLILPYNDPRWDKLFPPNGWNCRCFIVPRMASEFSKSRIAAMRKRADKYFKSKEFKFNQAQGWGVNRGKISEIFTANQQYVTKQPGKAARLLNSLKASDYGLPSYSNARKVATANLPEYSGKPSQFYASLEVINSPLQGGKGGVSVLRDYNNRPLELEAKNFETHTTGKKASRVKQLEAMRQTMKEPDEVWINGQQESRDLNDLVYIKYYQDKAMIVIGDIRKSQASSVSTWFTLTEKKRVIEKYRRGILIKSNK